LGILGVLFSTFGGILKLFGFSLILVFFHLFWKKSSIEVDFFVSFQYVIDC